MSDYLANLAARSLAPERSVQPRLAARFEPVVGVSPGWTDPAPEAPPLLAEVVEGGVAARPAPTRPSEPRGQRAVPPEEPIEEPARPRRSRRRAAESDPEPAPEPVRWEGARAPRPPETRELPEPPEIRSVPARRPPPRPLSHLPPTLSPGEGRDATANPSFQAVSPQFLPSPGGGTAGEGRGAGGEGASRMAPLPSPSPPPPRPAPVTEDRATLGPPPRTRRAGTVEPVAPREEPPRPAVLPRPSPPPAAQAPRPAPPTRVLVEPRVSVAPPAPPPVPSAPIRAAEAPEPTIHVTIGRIEVRATPPPAQPSRPRQAASSALSLEEYLRRRSKGGDG
jgi:hypothetical protein